MIRLLTTLVAVLVVQGCGLDVPFPRADQTARDSTVAQDAVAPDGSVGGVAGSDVVVMVVGDSARAIPDSLTDEAVVLALGELARQVRDNREPEAEELNLVRFIGRAALSLLLFLVLNWIIGRGADWTNAQADRFTRWRMPVKKAVPIVRIGLSLLAAYLLVVLVLGVDARGLVAAGAALGVAIGFAAQDVLKNFFGGLIVIFDQPFQVGDKVTVGGTYGEVVSIGLRSTRIVTPSDDLVSVPNSEVVEAQVANSNAGQLTQQVVAEVYLPGSVDERVAASLAREAALCSEFVYHGRPVVVLVSEEFRETFLLKVTIKAYVLEPRFDTRLRSDLVARARAAFREAGLGFADQRFAESASAGSADRPPGEGGP